MARRFDGVGVGLVAAWGLVLLCVSLTGTV